jgi:hypothetical protein
VRGLDNSSRQLEDELLEIVTTYRDLDFDYYLAHRQEMPDQIPNEEDAVRDWLMRSPSPVVQS